MLRLKTTLVSILDSNPAAHSSDAEAEQILFHVLRLEKPELNSIKEIDAHKHKISPETETIALRLAYARADGRPLQHILGYKFFYEHEYQVNASTLIPRPETEILVDTAIAWLEKKFVDQTFRMAELGIGSGIISGEILSHFPKAHCYASELNPEAIELALQNLGRILGSQFQERIAILPANHGRTGFEVFQASAPFDLIISNPPYVSKSDEIQKEVLENEPHAALFPKVANPEIETEEQPNFFYENFLIHAKEVLRPTGCAFFEVPHERAEALRDQFLANGFTQVSIFPDLTGRYRVLQAAF